MATETSLFARNGSQFEPSRSMIPLTETRPWYDHPLVVLAVLAGPLLMQITPWWQPADDAIGYMSLAKSIAGGGPLRTLGSPVLHYALGYPVLIAPIFMIDGLPLVQLLMLNFLFAMLTAYGVYLWARNYVASSAFFITGLTLWNASYWDLYRQPLSETAFLAALIWSALACRRLLAARNTREIVLMTIVAAILMIVVSSIRQVGIFLAAGFGVAAIIRAVRHELSWSRATITTLAIGVPASVLLVGLLIMYRTMAEGDPKAHTYVDLIVDPNMTFVQQLAESVRLRTAEIGRQLLPGFFKAYGQQGEWLNINTLIYLVFSAAIFNGWWKLVRRDYDVLVLMFPFYLAVYLLWPFDQGTRFMAPMLPVLWVCAWKLVTKWAAHPNPLLATLLIAHLAQSCVYLGSYVAAAKKCSDDLHALIELAPAFRGQHASVCGAGISIQTEMFVNLLLDDRISNINTDTTSDEDAKWFISEDSNAEIPGFQSERRSGRIALFARSE